MIEVENKVQRYDAYKDSGVEWLGEIPEHWELRRIKYLFNEINERSDNGNEDLLSVSQYTGVTNKSDKVEAGGMLTNALTLEGYKKVKKGDLVSNIMLAWNGSLGFSPFDGITSPAYSIYRIYGENHNRYFHYLLRTELYKAEFKRNSSGVIESRLRLYTDDFFNIQSILPPLSEQTAIAQFLDDKTTKIDDAIAIKEQQINLLKERKQILIHKAVTRGLDDSVTLKDSGVEWIGEIPEGWKITYLKRYCLKVTDGSHHSPQTQYEGKSYISVKDVNAFGEIDTINCKKINQKDFDDLARNGCQPKKNDILLTKDGTIGRAAIVNSDNDFVVLSSLGIITPDLNEFDSSFLRYYLISPLCVSQMYSLIAGSALTRLTIEKINRLFVIIPPLSEQKEIVEYIETASQKIERAIGLKQQEIAKLKEYKRSLINGVVTGKVRVC
ncbi:restriction endonuclease subunit S [Winogradskyella undariae]|uniref:restriction endonuclease subunit S n=1 Tax=Winogradskyella undariae TaxID=1285465 RepID=UPI0015C9DB36|nr:restriction endonuclease subunit S [Winogradskyella undariae]